MLKQIRVLDYSGNYSYAPPTVDALVNTEEIVSAVPCASRRSEETMRLRMTDGSCLIAVGVPADLLSGPEVRQ
jgi:hypothetical protein